MKKLKFLLGVLAIYLFAFMGCGYITHLLNIEQIILRLFIFDIMATVVVYIFSCILHNSSVYDPYWSVMPGAFAIYLMIYYKAFTWMHFVVLAAILFYSLRLTINWILVTTGIDYEDWRYRHFREISGNKFMWFIYNFFGIHLVPTLFVFLGMLPMFDIFRVEELNVASLVGVLVLIIGVILEILADIDMHKFLDTTKEKVTCRTGLWNYSRHPNYLGEITIWLGVYLIMIFTITTHWYDIIGFLGMVFMFNVISIPLMENRQIKRRSDYETYKKEVHRLLILPNKKAKAE